MRVRAFAVVLLIDYLNYVHNKFLLYKNGIAMELNFAVNLIKMVIGKEVTPRQKKLGTATNKKFILAMSKDTDYNLLKGERIHFL